MSKADGSSTVLLTAGLPVPVRGQPRPLAGREHRRLAGAGMLLLTARHDGDHVLVFTESAAWYDRFQAGKDYAGEARQVTSLIRRHQPAARTLLDVACGTGQHLLHFSEMFTCHGLDLDGGLLDVARSRLPGVPFTRADMTAFDLGQRFDAVTCLFSSIGYAGTTERLHAAAGVMARHLNPGGVLIIEPWILPERWPEFDGHSHADTICDGHSTLVRVRTNRRSGTTTELLMHYVAAGRGQITTADETHRLRMFTRAEYLDAVAAAGLHPEWDPDGITGRGLLIATQKREPEPDELPGSWVAAGIQGHR